MSGSTPIRVGIQSVSTLTATGTAEQAISAALGTTSDLTATTQPFNVLQTSIEAGAFAFSTLFGVQEKTGAFIEAYWPLKVMVGILDDVVVKYVDIEVSGREQGTETPTTNSDSSFVYTLGTLTQVTYADGTYKQLTYSGGRLSQVEHITQAGTLRKTFDYDFAGKLISVIQETV